MPRRTVSPQVKRARPRLRKAEPQKNAPRPALQPLLNALWAFDAAARHQGFARAGAALSLSPAAISRQVRILEQRCGAPLFQRAAQGVTLTEAGRRLRAATAAAFDILAGALPQVSAPGDLSLQVSATFYLRWLLPRRAELMAALPKLTLRLDVTGSPGANTGCDLAILYHPAGIPAAPNSARLFEDNSILVAAPALLGRRKPPLPMSSLARLPLIANTIDDWDWHSLASVHRLKLPQLAQALRFDLDDGAIQAALAGEGVALVERRFVADALASGALVEPFPLKPVSLGAYCLHWRANLARRPQIQALRDWLLRAVKQQKM